MIQLTEFNANNLTTTSLVLLKLLLQLSTQNLVSCVTLPLISQYSAGCLSKLASAVRMYKMALLPNQLSICYARCLN